MALNITSGQPWYEFMLPNPEEYVAWTHKLEATVAEVAGGKPFIIEDIVVQLGSQTSFTDITGTRHLAMELDINGMGFKLSGLGVVYSWDGSVPLGNLETVTYLMHCQRARNDQ